MVYLFAQQGASTQPGSRMPAHYQRKAYANDI